VAVVKGRYDEGQGYILLYLSDGTMRREHRVVMEELLGRSLLRTEVVHHRDGNRSNNAIENLELMNIRDHHYHHQDERWVSAVELRCPGCAAVFLREKRQTHLAKGGNFTACCRPCIGRTTALIRKGVPLRDAVGVNVLRVCKVRRDELPISALKPA
jgi:hypothetical protein